MNNNVFKVGTVKGLVPVPNENSTGENTVVELRISSKALDTAVGLAVSMAITTSAILAYKLVKERRSK